MMEHIEEMLSQWLTHKDDHRLAFNDAHIALAAGASGDTKTQAQALAAMNQFLEDKSHLGETSHSVALVIGKRLLEGILDYRNGKYKEAVIALLSVRYKVCQLIFVHKSNWAEADKVMSCSCTR